MNDDDAVLVTVRVPTAGGPDGLPAVDLVAAALWGQGAIAVEIREEPGVTTLLAGYPTAAAARAVAAGMDPALGVRAEAVTDRSWRDAWRAWVQPVPVGRSLMVVPSWRPVPVDSGRITVEIDPGPCFGSGTHPSTRMLLGWLDAHPPVGARVIDVGTGSGILAVAAARLGAASVTAIDIDPEAVVVTGANAARNGVGGVVAASTTGVEALPAAGAEVVMVNVTAGTHAAIGAASAQTVAPGGTLLIAGLLPGQWQHVAGAYAGLAEEDRLELDGWEGAVLARPGRLTARLRSAGAGPR